MSHTIVRHNRLGSYNMLDRSDKTESYYIKFANGKEARFTYKEDDAPLIDFNETDQPLDWVENLRKHPKSVKYLFSSDCEHFQEKTHEERITLCQKWVQESMKEDSLEWSKRLSKKAGDLLEKAAEFQKSARFLMEEHLQLSALAILPTTEAPK